MSDDAGGYEEGAAQPTESWSLHNPSGDICGTVYDKTQADDWIKSGRGNGRFVRRYAIVPDAGGFEERLDLFEEKLRKKLVCRHAWTAIAADGLAMTCALATMYPEALGDSQRGEPSRCPTAWTPEWLNYLIPWIDDAGSVAAWDATMAELVRVLRRSVVLTSQDWVELDYVVRAIAIREAMRHTTDRAMLAAYEGMVLLCAHAGSGGEVSQAEWIAGQLASWWMGGRAWLEATASSWTWWWASMASGLARMRAAPQAADRLIADIFSAIEARCAMRQP